MITDRLVRDAAGMESTQRTLNLSERQSRQLLDLFAGEDLPRRRLQQIEDRKLIDADPFEWSVHEFLRLRFLAALAALAFLRLPGFKRP